ncbi:hypothetical protein [Aequorivita echinoideorum]|nr:hypothetical protein [Aequorivita echinoideorum]
MTFISEIEIIPFSQSLKLYDVISVLTDGNLVGYEEWMDLLVINQI